MKHSLSTDQEKVFWHFVTEDLIKTLSLPKELKSWGNEQRMEINQALAKVLFPLCKKDKVIQGHCNFVDDEIDKGEIDMWFTIRKNIINKHINKTHPYSKHRFAYFLIGKSADDYIDKREVLTKTLPTEPFLSGDAVKTLAPFVQEREYFAYKIVKELEKYEEEDAQTFLRDFKELHQKLVEFFGMEKGISTGIRVYVDIHKLGEYFFTQTETGKKISAAQNMWGNGFYLREDSPLANINGYLVLTEEVNACIEAFKKIENKEEQDYFDLLKEILNA